MHAREYSTVRVTISIRLGLSITTTAIPEMAADLAFTDPHLYSTFALTPITILTQVSVKMVDGYVHSVLSRARSRTQTNSAVLFESAFAFPGIVSNLGFSRLQAIDVLKPVANVYVTAFSVVMPVSPRSVW